MPIGLITGITGQDGSYLAELLLEKGYRVCGIVRRSSTFNLKNIEHLTKKIELFYGDITDPACVMGILSKFVNEEERIEIYNLAAQSHVMTSFEMPFYTAQVDAIGTLNILEGIRLLNLKHKCRFYQASTSELFGKVVEVPQKETTPFYPRSPYGVAKLYAYWIVKNYREAYGIYGCNGILFNHESERRGKNFVTRKITWTIGQVLRGERKCLELGNLDARRDWGYAPDYVEGMWRILQEEEADDFVLATGEYHAVREFVEKSFQVAGIEIIWEGEGLDEVGKDKRSGNVLVKINPSFFRPTEVDELLGDPTKARRVLGWKPTVSFDEMIKRMVNHDMMGTDLETPSSPFSPIYSVEPDTI